MTFAELREALRERRDYVGVRVFVEDDRGELHAVTGVDSEVVGGNEVITVIAYDREVTDL